MRHAAEDRGAKRTPATRAHHEQVDMPRGGQKAISRVVEENVHLAVDVVAQAVHRRTQVGLLVESMACRRSLGGIDVSVQSRRRPTSVPRRAWDRAL